MFLNSYCIKHIRFSFPKGLNRLSQSQSFPICNQQPVCAAVTPKTVSSLLFLWICILFNNKLQLHSLIVQKPKATSNLCGCLVLRREPQTGVHWWMLHLSKAFGWSDGERRFGVWVLKMTGWILYGSESPPVFARKWWFIGFQHHFRGFTKLDLKKRRTLLSPAFREWGVWIGWISKALFCLILTHCWGFKKSCQPLDTL